MQLTDHLQASRKCDTMLPLPPVHCGDCLITHKDKCAVITLTFDKLDKNKNRLYKNISLCEVLFGYLVTLLPSAVYAAQDEVSHEHAGLNESGAVRLVTNFSTVI
jgi:hypothetical protein